MVDQDLIAVIKNALDRGEALEAAKISLINAGYPKHEVEEAANQLTQSREISATPQAAPAPTSPSPEATSPPAPQAPFPQTVFPQPAKAEQKIGSKKKIILLIIILSILALSISIFLIIKFI